MKKTIFMFLLASVLASCGLPARNTQDTSSVPGKILVHLLPPAGPEARTPPTDLPPFPDRQIGYTGGSFDTPHIPNRFLALGVTPQEAMSIPNVTNATLDPDTGLLVVYTTDGKEASAAQDLFNTYNRPGVYVSLDVYYIFQSAYVPNDEGYQFERQYDSVGFTPSGAFVYGYPFYAKAMNLEQAWGIIKESTYDMAPVVGLIDGAVHTGISEFDNYLGTPPDQQVPGYERNVFIDAFTVDPTGGTELLPENPPEKVQWNFNGLTADHGEEMASLIFALSDNNLAYPSASFNLARGIAVRAAYFPDAGDPSKPMQLFRASTWTLYQAVTKAVQRGAHILVIGFGNYMNDRDPVLRYAIRQAYEQGVLVIAPAGNGYYWAGNLVGQQVLMTPAHFDEVLAVGSVRKDGRTPSDFSNFSLEPTNLVFAPGGNMNPLEEIPAYGYPLLSNGTFSQVTPFYGTSFAAAFVTGIAAQYFAHYHAHFGRFPAPDQAMDCLTHATNQHGVYNQHTGYGVVQADQVLTDTTYCMK